MVIDKLSTFTVVSNDDPTVMCVFRRQTFSPIGEVSELPDPKAFFEKKKTYQRDALLRTRHAGL